MMSTNLTDLKHLLNLKAARQRQLLTMQNFPQTYGNDLVRECKGEISALNRAIERLEKEPDVAEMIRLKEIDPGRELGDALGGG